ncbi:Disease resistance protein RGA2 [Ananas comosus]|uniref:Disease resistance protein RGA2 n=1 Tax=Ananas comosus TaxID=4615 RepID=A0A199UNJ9_ANACO|nr:Disease resistance protein RGA2 [Ananas comosus]
MAAAAVSVSLLCSFVDVLIANKLSAKALKELGSQCGVAQELDRARSLLEATALVIPAAERRSLEGDVAARSWLSGLADAAYHLDGMLDELECEAHRSLTEVRGDTHSFSAFSHSFRTVFFAKFKTTVERLHAFDKEKHALGLRAPERKRRVVDTKLRSYSSKFIGRCGEIDNILKSLVTQHSSGENINAETGLTQPVNKLLDTKNICVVAVTGPQGIGKTALVKKVYHHRVVTDYFPLRIWVSVSTSPVGSGILDGAVDDVSEPYPYSGPSRLSTLRLLGENLIELLAGRRFLLVLDGVQTEHLSDWELLCRNLFAGERGSRVVATTRSSSVAKMMCTADMFSLDGLSESDSWSLLKTCTPTVLSSKKKGNGKKKKNSTFKCRDLDKNENLDGVGQEITKLLGGSPGAIRIIASLLPQQQDSDFRREIPESCKAKGSATTDAIALVLKVTYDSLPSHLKLCLLCCSLYPRGHKFEKLNLVDTWIAGGFVLPNKEVSIEEQAIRCFDELLAMSFLDSCGDKYCLHDSVHQISSHMLVLSCLRRNWSSEIPTEAVHLSLVSDNLLASEYKYLSKFKNLRSLVFLRESNYRSDYFTEEIFQEMKSLRVLDLSHSGIKEVPSSVGELTHLRLLNLSYTLISSVPETLSNLSKLQILDLSGCLLLFALPAWMNKMTSLRRLKASPNLACSIGEIGKLTSLQNLEEFRVHKRDGRRVTELKNMNELHGKLRIRNVENISSGAEATEAGLEKKAHLERLELEWSDDRRDTPLDVDVLEGLKPPSSIEMIGITGFSGSEHPKWVHKLSTFKQLETISFRDCRGWQDLPPLGDAPRLKLLDLCRLERVRKLDNLMYGLRKFPSLVELRLHDLRELKECARNQGLSKSDKAASSSAGTTRATNRESRTEDSSGRPRQLAAAPLARLHRWCPDLESLGMEQVKTLEVLTIRKCKSLASITKRMVSEFTLPEICVIEDCPNLTCPHDHLISGLSMYVHQFVEAIKRNLAARARSMLHLTAMLLQVVVACETPTRGLGISVLLCALLGALASASELEAAAALPPSLNALKIAGSPRLVRRPLLVELQSRPSLSSTVVGEFSDVASCVQAALRHLTALQSLRISFCDVAAARSPFSVSLEYNTSPPSYDGGAASSRAVVTVGKVDRRRGSAISDPTARLIAPRQLKYLKILELAGCPDLRSFPSDRRQLDHLTSLEDVTVADCGELRSVHLGAFGGSTLKRFTIRDCDKLTTFAVEDHGRPPRRPAALQRLVLQGCARLSRLPPNLRSLESLEVLHIANCPQLRRLPDDDDLPVSLKELLVR